MHGRTPTLFPMEKLALRPSRIIAPTIVGTDKINAYFRTNFLEKPLRADVAIVQGYIADESGNVRYKGSTRNFNPLMASAADTVIVEVEKIVPAGEIGPDYVETPHIYVDYLVLKEEA